MRESHWWKENDWFRAFGLEFPRTSAEVVGALGDAVKPLAEATAAVQTWAHRKWEMECECVWNAIIFEMLVFVNIEKLLFPTIQPHSPCLDSHHISTNGIHNHKLLHLINREIVNCSYSVRCV